MRVLIIGAGIGQIFLARKVKERGHFLVTVTLPGNQPVIDIADQVCYINVFDKEGVLKIAREQKIDAVISDQNDTMMPTVAYVAEKMNLPGLRIAQVDAYCNKNHFRDNCDRLGIPVPRHKEVTSEEIPSEFMDTPFPWIVKPADSQSSLGVKKVNSAGEYKDALKRALGFSKTNSAIIEEFFSGQELVAEGFIYKGKYYGLGFADRKYFNSENLFIPAQTIFPSTVNSDVLNRISVCEEKMAAYINPEFAIVHSEYLYDAQTDKFCVVETAVRGGGVYISSHIIPLYSGIDVNDLLLDCACGHEIDVESVLANKNNKAAGYICFYLPEGIVSSVEGIEDVRNMECVKMMCLSEITVGSVTPPLTHKGQRLGPIIVTGYDRHDIERNISLVQNTLKATVTGLDGIQYGINWK